MKDPAIQDARAWAQSGDRTDFERRLLEAATHESIPQPLKGRMSDAFHAQLASLPAVSASLGAGGSLFLSKTAAVGLASALLIGGAATWQWLRSSDPPVEQPPMAAAPATPAEPPGSSAPAEPPIAAPASQLRHEILALDAARAALKASQPARALERLATYERDFPNGVLVPEATALRIEALVHSGAERRAKELAQQFLAAHPGSPLAHRVQRLAPRAK